jgi:hypothetical protein
MESPPGSERVSRRLREQFAPAYLAITGLVQVLSQGPPDLVLARRSYGHIDVAWEDPGITLFLRTLASFCRLILFDRRGTGPSDPLPPGPLPPWESYAEELTAVLDEVGCERAAIMAELDAGPPRCCSPGPGRNAPARWSWCTPRPGSWPETTTRSGSPQRMSRR